MGKLAGFNKLPPRPIYIELVMKSLEKQSLTLSEIIAKTRLTRTQVACTLDMLIADNNIETFKENKKTYYRKINEI